MYLMSNYVAACNLALKKGIRCCTRFITVSDLAVTNHIRNESYYLMLFEWVLIPYHRSSSGWVWCMRVQHLTINVYSIYNYNYRIIVELVSSFSFHEFRQYWDFSCRFVWFAYFFQINTKVNFPVGSLSNFYSHRLIKKTD